MSEYNEDAYRQARKDYIPTPCPFERALLSLCVGCSRARKLNLAEREAISCGDAAVQPHCRALYQALHDNARFALKVQQGVAWPFGKEIRAQCGGLRGLAAVMGGDGGYVDDTAATVLAALERHGEITALPYPEIMRGVVHYQPRQRRR